MVRLPKGVTPFIHITQNEFFRRKHKKLKEDDIAICECKYDASDPESACGERCLNMLTNFECTPGYCQCGETCKNQIFQKCEYAKTRLFRTKERGWDLLAGENIEVGQFIIEYCNNNNNIPSEFPPRNKTSKNKKQANKATAHPNWNGSEFRLWKSNHLCGEVISSEEAKKRSHIYEAHELKDTYIISLDANYSIDATWKGSFARFINHSCRPNCETRKWTVLGETRVGIVAVQDISVEMELTINYCFEWYGGATVCCLCGAANCSIFLGAKSHGFQEYNHVRKDGDDRYTVEPSNSTLKKYNIGSGSTMQKKSQRIPKRKKSRCIPKRKVKSSSRKQVNVFIEGSKRRSYQV